MIYNLLNQLIKLGYLGIYLLLTLFLFHCASSEEGTKKQNNSPLNVIFGDIAADYKIVLVDQKFTVYRNLKSFINQDVGYVKQILYINGFLHSSLICNLRAKYECPDGFMLSIPRQGTYKLKIVLEPNSRLVEIDKEKYKDEIEIKVHDGESFLKDGLHILEVLRQLSGKYKNHQITREEFEASVKKLAEYTDDMARVNFHIVKPPPGLKQYDHFAVIGIKKLSAGLWSLWVYLLDSNKNFHITETENSTTIPIRSSQSIKTYVNEAKRDLLIALNILIGKKNIPENLEEGL